MFLGFLCTVKTLRSLLFGQNSRQDLPSQFRLILGEAGGYKTSKWLTLYFTLYEGRRVQENNCFVVNPLTPAVAVWVDL